MIEIWKPIKGYEQDYLISTIGRVKSIKFSKEKLLKTFNTRDGKYDKISLQLNGIEKKFSIHRLVAEAFIEILKISCS